MIQNETSAPYAQDEHIHEEQPLLRSDPVPTWTPPPGFLLIQIGKLIVFREKHQFIDNPSNHGQCLPWGL
jgi:hypothetical protein